MRVLLLADFRRDHPRFLLNNSRMFAKGFTRLGHDVECFSYREMMLQLSWLPSRRWAGKLAKKKTDHLLADLAGHYQPDVVFITAFKQLDGQTVTHLRRVLPQARFACWYGDLRRDRDPKVAAIARQMDVFFATSGGEVLQRYKALGIPRCVFMPNPVDRDIEKRYPVSPDWRSDAVFIGKLMHSQPGQDALREELLKRLASQGLLTLWGAMGKPQVTGRDYLFALSGAKIALSINVFNDVPKYHSDRLVHCLSCGTFTLAKRVPETDLLFEDGKHLRYFDGIDDCLELIHYYLEHDVEREAIAQAGQRRAYEAFDAAKLAGYILDVIDGKEFDEPWYECI